MYSSKVTVSYPSTEKKKSPIKVIKHYLVVSVHEQRTETIKRLGTRFQKAEFCKHLFLRYLVLLNLLFIAITLFPNP